MLSFSIKTIQMYDKYTAFKKITTINYNKKDHDHHFFANWKQDNFCAIDIPFKCIINFCVLKSEPQRLSPNAF